VSEGLPVAARSRALGRRSSAAGAIGMVMDPYGAVILVHATLARVAEDNGIGEG